MPTLMTQANATITFTVQRPIHETARSIDVIRCRRKFLRYFPDGFQDETYVAWERGYKWSAHRRWTEELGAETFRRLLRQRAHAEIARRAIAIESRTNLLFSFEKMAVRDAVRSRNGVTAFAEGLYDLLHGKGRVGARFEEWVQVLAELPRKQTRVLTWPVATVFGFLAQPKLHFFVKPRVMQRAAEAYGWPFAYSSTVSWDAYENVLGFARAVRRDLSDLRPRDMIDIQSFLWVQGSDEYSP
jgi:hypothetical protein